MQETTNIYPTSEELSKITTNVKCPNCTAIFNSESNLTLHLSKTHKIPDLLQSNGTKRYFCPAAQCTYHRKSSFPQLKLCKQHFLKVHAAKHFLCECCNKGFATLAFKNKHFEYCNVAFKCCDCEAFYGSYETLKTHARRKRHKILEKVEYKAKDKSNDVVVKVTGERDRKHNQETQTDVAQASVETQTQPQDTEMHRSSSMLIETLDSNYFNCNMETQTDVLFNPEYCDEYSNSIYTQTTEFLEDIELNDTQTQTVFDDLLKSVESQTMNSHVTHMETQTDSLLKEIFDEIL